MSFWSTFRWNRSGGNTILVGGKQPAVAITATDIEVSKTRRVQYSDNNAEASNSMALSDDSYQPVWTFLGNPNVDGMDYPAVGQIVVDSEDERILYVMVYQAGLFVSRDGGLSWELAVPGEPPLYGVIAKDPNTVDRVFYDQAFLFLRTVDRYR
jgi:hypothetical protein